MADFETNEKGNVVLKPVSGWTTAQMAGVLILLQMRYLDAPGDIQTTGKAIQFGMTPNQCLLLAEELTRQANRLLETPPPEATRQ